MCEYLSFLTDLKGDNFKFHPALMSHSATHEFHKLMPDQWREAEWTSNDAGESLVVRTHEDDPHDAPWLRACILAKWPTRKALETWVIENVVGSLVSGRFAEGGNGSTLTGGDESTLTGGNGSTLTGGDESTLTGGDKSTLTGGNGSVLVFDWWDGMKQVWKREVAVVGKDADSGIAYHVDGGKIVAAIALATGAAS